jgi:DNA (cytosine-5)-methyltransferase 1
VKVLDLYAGIGGFALGLERAGFETVAFCEAHPHARALLRKNWPETPIYEDVRSLTADRLRADGIAVDVITGGFPCQPFSTASRGRRVAVDLWGEMRRLVGELRPRFVLAENVPGLGLDGVDRVCGDLEAAGYTVWPYRLDTAPPGRQRGRERFIFVAHANRDREPRRTVDAEVARLCGLSVGGLEDVPAPVGVDDGLPGRMDRLNRLGNALPPQVPQVIGRVLAASC